MFETGFNLCFVTFCGLIYFYILWLDAESIHLPLFFWLNQLCNSSASYWFKVIVVRILGNITVYYFSDELKTWKKYFRFKILNSPASARCPDIRTCSRTGRQPLRRWRRCLCRCKSEAPSSKATPQLIELCPQSIPRQLGCNELCPLNRKRLFLTC